jgi:hypothetical protein
MFSFTFLPLGVLIVRKHYSVMMIYTGIKMAADLVDEKFCFL